MEVQGVDLEHSHDVQLLLHVLHRDEMAAWVEMETTIAKSRRILDVATLRHPLHAFHLGRTLHLGRQELQETLHAIEGTLARLRLDGDSLGCDAQVVTLLCHLQGWGNLDADVPLLRVGGNLVSCRCLELVGQVLCDGLPLCGIIGDQVLG